MMQTQEEFRPGFDWVARELVLPDAHREAVFSAVFGTLHEGMDRRLKALRASRPEGIHWPSGHDYLQETLRQDLEDEDEWQDGDPMPEVPELDLLKLLLMRFSHVAQRLVRNQQIREACSEEYFRRRHPFIVMNREPREEHALCGRDSSVKLPIEDGLLLMDQLACSHPACCCTFDPAKA